MSVPFALLGLLEREPSHGYDLKRSYDTYFGRGKPLSDVEQWLTEPVRAESHLQSVLSPRLCWR